MIRDIFEGEPVNDDHIFTVRLEEFPVVTEDSDLWIITSAQWPN